MWHVRSKLQCPPAATYPYEPKWKLEAAAAELTGVVLEPSEEPPKPDVSAVFVCGWRGYTYRDRCVSL